MKKLIILSCALVSFLAASPARAQAIKIGTVDMEKIFNAYYKTKDADVKINAARAGLKKELDDRMEVYKETMDDIRRLDEELQNGGLSDQKKEDITKTRDEKLNDFKNQDRELKEFQAEKEKGLSDDAMRLRDEIVADIMKLVNAKIKSENYDYVFDKTGLSVRGVPVVLYARDAVDFSDEIIAQLNKNKPKDTSTPASTSPTPKPSSAQQP